MPFKRDHHRTLFIPEHKRKQTKESKNSRRFKCCGHCSDHSIYCLCLTYYLTHCSSEVLRRNILNSAFTFTTNIHSIRALCATATALPPFKCIPFIQRIYTSAGFNADFYLSLTAYNRLLFIKLKRLTKTAVTKQFNLC